MTYQLVDSQFYGLLDDEPPIDYIYEALDNVQSILSKNKEAWFCKGNYQIHYWTDLEDKDVVYCNAYVLSNPDDENDSSTEPYSYYYELRKESC